MEWQRGTTVLSHVFHLLQFLSLSDGGEKRPLALSAIPTEIHQGEEHPVSTVSPLNTLPEVRTTAPAAFTPHSPHSPCHPHSNTYQFSSLLTAKRINSHLSRTFPLAPVLSSHR